jgi:hypothetical protein
VAGRFRVEALIGEGGYGAVFRATEVDRGRAVALKVLFAHAAARDGLPRFLREADLARRLSHPNTVRVLDFGRAEDGAPWLAFELLEGRTLDAALRAEGALAPARVARIGAQVLKSLMEAHAAGIVHRDVKPANVFLTRFEGEPELVKVLDFGIAKGAGLGALTAPGEVVGTAAYMAPEQLLGAATFASDLYALGLTMAEALSGRRVFAQPSAAEVASAQLAPEPVPLSPEVLGSPLARVIARATQKQAAARYASAAEMLAELEPVAAPVRARPSRLWLALAVPIAAALAAALLLAGGRFSPVAPPLDAGPPPFVTRLRLAEVTSGKLFARCSNSGFTITRATTVDQGEPEIVVGIKRGPAAGSAIIHRAPSLAAAEALERRARAARDTAFVRQAQHVMVVTLHDPARPGPAAAREAMEEICADGRDHDKPAKYRRELPTRD